jgi:hypothetical protein
MALHVASPSTTIAVRIAVGMLALRESSSGPRGHRVSAVPGVRWTNLWCAGTDMGPASPSYGFRQGKHEAIACRVLHERVRSEPNKSALKPPLTCRLRRFFADRDASAPKFRQAERSLLFLRILRRLVRFLQKCAN